MPPPASPPRHRRVTAVQPLSIQPPGNSCAAACVAALPHRRSTAAQVLSADEARAERVGAQLEAGNVWVNCNQALWPCTPFGGWKASGFGKEYGEAGLHEYLKHKTLTSARPGFSWAYYG